MRRSARVVISSCQLGSQGLSRAWQFVFFEFQYSSIVIKIVLDICNVSIKLSFTKTLVLFIVSKIIISGNKLRYRLVTLTTYSDYYGKGSLEILKMFWWNCSRRLVLVMYVMLLELCTKKRKERVCSMTPWLHDKIKWQEYKPFSYFECL